MMNFNFFHGEHFIIYKISNHYVEINIFQLYLNFKNQWTNYRKNLSLWIGAGIV